ncbi:MULTISPECIES: LysM domain-containing protein [unclassified Facklamia]|uniref:LysM peptidoglycan-binding domain-containing protein n=1 Tax=Aerococcaceae TaxID=186827 RepID=UPI0013BDD249|nr:MULTISPECIES: LysM domain-containing protein [unclassified Facklamia]NEW64317.1 LysM peptidoglycan-binding domain-containing protein [Facklamia sp. 252]NEW67846.1 LysM peptidoglycan-binding domain-containing protein [Facklamia sp. 253]QQD64782.1 LysM peptidoglycan-binding domain-containing protein [Aerococcaceae bacterium zg-252]
MNLKNKLILASSVALLVLPLSTNFVEAQQLEWKPRTVEQVKADLEKDEHNEVKYTIKYGDTLSVIAEALDMDVKVLGQINDIIDLDLIFPDTVLTATYNKANKVAKLVVETPAEEKGEEPTKVAEVDFEKNEVKLEDKTVELEEVNNSTTATAPVEPVQEWVTTETTAVSTVQATPNAVETTTSEVVAPTVEETTQEESVVAEPVVTEETTVSTESETVVEEPVVTEAPVEEVPSANTTDLYANPENAGLQAHVAAFKEEVAAAFGITSFSTFRPGDPGDHGKGLAVDFMVPVSSELGDAVAQYAISQIGTGKVSYVIWKQQIYGDWNLAWTMMEDRGSITANHYDHVHVSFYP